MAIKEVHTPKYIKLDYSQITPYIFLGTDKCCFPIFDRRLKKIGIKAGVSLEDSRFGTVEGLEYYLWLPTKDHEPPTQNQLIIGAKYIKELADKKIKVYVHCKLGHTRSPTLVAAYLILEGMTVKGALVKIKKKRPVVHPTKSQISALNEFYENLKKN